MLRARPAATIPGFDATKARADFARQTFGAALEPQSFDAESNTIGLVWQTGARMQRFGMYFDEYANKGRGEWAYGPFELELGLEAKHVRLGRLNDSAPFLANHDSCSLESVLGKVVPGSVKLVAVEGGGRQGVARIALSKEPADATIVNKITSGLISNISAGVLIHKLERLDAADDEAPMPVFKAVDHEPYELSAVPVAADPGAPTFALFPDPVTPEEVLPMSDPNPTTLNAEELRAEATRE